MNKILPNAYLKKYQQLLSLLGQLQEVVLDPVDSLPLVAQKGWENFLALQDFYQQQIFPLVGEELVGEEFAGEIAPEMVSRWRSLNTEIHRSMKLLALDMSLLKAARSLQMQKTRKEGISDRLSTLISYCQVILTTDSANPT